jgi:hypothetical protein
MTFSALRHCQLAMSLRILGQLVCEPASGLGAVARRVRSGKNPVVAREVRSVAGFDRATIGEGLALPGRQCDLSNLSANIASARAVAPAADRR